MPFVHHVRARFYEIDRAGILFFGRVYEYCHAAFEELLGEVFGDFEAWFRSTSVGLPLVHSEADYRRPIRMGERLTVELSVAELGPGSITFAYAILGPKGDRRASVKLVHAFVELAGFKRSDRPPDGLEAGLARLGLLEREE